MSSINTNVQAMTALKALNATNKALESTQTRISTGFKVGEASDNAAYWSIATTMRSDNKALGTVKDALGLGQAKIDTAYTGMNAAIEVVDEIKTKLVAASEPGVDQSKIDKEITALKDQLKSITTSASFSGENWLANNGAVGTKS
ncbi:MAG: flagellin, partial [Brevundimonas sp.]|nr:flagellin [Brevundimonas sp.]